MTDAERADGSGRKVVRPASRRRKVLLALLSIVLVLVVLLLLGRWRLTAVARHEKAVAEAPMPNLDVLPDGVVVFAPDGSVAAGLIDWLEDGTDEKRYFEVGGTQYEGRSVIPVQAARKRLPALVDLMNAYPRLQLTVVGHTSPMSDREEEVALSERRADWVAHALVAARVNPKRVRSRGAGASERIADGSAEDRVGLLLERD